MTTFVLQPSAEYPVAIKLIAPVPSYIGYPSEPFTLYLSAADINSHVIHLYAENSNSIPYQQPQNKWSHLLPQWRFTDLDGNYIESIILTNSSLVTNLSGDIIGMTASGQFLYVDDSPTIGCTPILIWATVDFSDYPTYLDENRDYIIQPGYSNSRVSTVVAAYVNGLTPNTFNITRNGQYPLFNSYWINTHLSHIITVNGNADSLISFNPEIEYSPILFDIPITNNIGEQSGPINRTLSVLPISTNITWTPTNLQSYLSAYDDKGFLNTGFLKSNFITSEQLLSTTILVSGQVYNPNIWSHNCYFWISNPENNSINRIYYPCIDQTIVSTVTSFFQNDYVLTPDIDSFDISQLQVLTAEFMGLTGFGGIYGIAMDPFYNIWTSDSESDRLYKFSSEGQLLSTINFGEYGITPAGISLDGIGNLWVSFFDAESAVKLDANTGEIKKIIQFGYPLPSTDPLFTPWTSADNLYKPTLVETDKNNQIWISYTNTVSSALYKFKSNGVLIHSITLPLCSNPMDICIDSDNNIWTSLTFHSGPPYGYGEVRKYDSTNFTLLSTITAVNPEYLSIDENESIWFTQNWNTVTQVTTGNIQTSYIIGSSIPIIDNNTLEGLCCDSYNRVFVIESVENNLYKIENSTVKLVTEILPNSSVEYKSAQAFGDWNGYRWHKKYQSSKSEFKTLSGESNVFSVRDFSDYNIRKFNESWPASKFIHSLAKAPHIHDNDTLWNEYMDTLWGNEDTPYGTAYGRQAYERIANFTQNRADIDECNVSQIYDLAMKMDVPIDDYGFTYPLELRRVMDLVSINQQKLWGARCTCNKQLSEQYKTTIKDGQLTVIELDCPICGHKHSGNRGELFEPLTYMVSANVPFIIRDKYLEDQYQLITPPISTVAIMPSVTAMKVIFDSYWKDDYRITITSPLTTYVLRDEQRYVNWYNFTHPGGTVLGEDPNTYPLLNTPWKVEITNIDIPIESNVTFDLMNGWAPTWKYTGFTVVFDLTNGVSLTARNDASAGGTSLYPITTAANYYSVGPHFKDYKQVATFYLSSLLTPCNNTEQMFKYIYMYPLSAGYTWLLPDAQQANQSSYNNFLLNIQRFCFFDYVPAMCNEQIVGVINWDDKNTTLSEQGSSLSEWYGDNGIVETIINYTLHKGLGLIKE